VTDAPRSDRDKAAADTWRIEPLFEGPPEPGGRVRGGPLPPLLALRYGADLTFALRAGRPTIVSNFVSTIDGVVAFDTKGHSGGREVSGGSAPDRFLMGLLRATADAVLVGAGTLRSGSRHVWTPGHVHPPATAAYAAWRETVGPRSPQPTTVVVTASGQVDPEHPALHAPGVPVVLVTTTEGAIVLARMALPPTVELVVAGHGERVDDAALPAILAERSLDLVLCEGGPNLLGGLLRAGLVDELFLTVAPQIAGRAPEMPRLALVEGFGYEIGAAPWAELRSVMRSENHLFLRYRLDTAG
jgi:riboflavin biosynthesis pyrimidine reductase